MVNCLIHPTSGLKIIQVRQPEHSDKKVARVYGLKSIVPETILKEVYPGSDRFYDEVNGEVYQNTNQGMILLS